MSGRQDLNNLTLADTSPGARSRETLGSISSQLVVLDSSGLPHLVDEHLVHSLLQDLVSALRVNAIIRQSCDDLTVFRTFCKASVVARVGRPLDFLCVLAVMGFVEHIPFRLQCQFFIGVRTCI
jgi:hypothetical protein